MDASIRALTARFEEVTLSTDQKDDLFSEAITSLRQNVHETELILENLRHWSPELARPIVKRTPDTILDTPFRLVRERAQSQHETTGSYLCISYCWRREDFNGAGLDPALPFPFGEPFVQAVLDQSSSPKEGIWIDQLCIRQQDEAEKLRAIASMDVVYKSCRRLVIILEDAHLDDTEAAMFGKYDNKKLNFNVTWQPERSDVDALVSMCRKVTVTRWWTRAWCYHEFAVNEPWSAKRCNYDLHNAVFVLSVDKQPTSALSFSQRSNPNDIGTVSVKWITLQSILGRMILLFPERVEQDLGSPGTAFLSGLEDKTSPINDAAERRRGSEKSSILAKYHAVAATDCSVAQDRLSIALNLSGLSLAVEKKIADDLVEMTAVAISLAAGEKAALTFVNPLPTVIRGQESWFVTHHAGRDTALRKFRLGSNEGIKHIDVGKIELDLVVFNYSLSPRATDTDINFTRKVFQDEIPTTQPALKDGYTAKKSVRTRPNEELDPMRRQFLANCMRLGLGFVSRLWRVLQQQVVNESYASGPFAQFQANETFRSNAETLRGLATDPSALDLHDATLFLTWLTDPRSMYYISALSFVLLCTASEDGALLTSPIIREGFVGKQIRFAIPRDLVGHHCDPPRVWLLSPVEGSGIKEIGEGCPWHLVGKALLLGEPDLEVEMRREVPTEQKGVFHAHRQVVQW